MVSQKVRPTALRRLLTISTDFKYVFAREKTWRLVGRDFCLATSLIPGVSYDGFYLRVFGI